MCVRILYGQLNYQNKSFQQTYKATYAVHTIQSYKLVAYAGLATATVVTATIVSTKQEFPLNVASAEQEARAWMF